VRGQASSSFLAISQQIIQIAGAEQATRFILGLPVHKNGTKAEQTKVPIFGMSDTHVQRGTAARAHSRDPNRKLWGQLDAKATCILLENYYLNNGKGAEQVPVTADMLEHYTRLYEEHESQAGQRLQSILDQRGHPRPRVVQLDIDCCQQVLSIVSRQKPNSNDSNSLFDPKIPRMRMLIPQ
jgi:hypothetical protein